MATLPVAQTRLPAINKATTVSASHRRKIEPSASWAMPVVTNECITEHKLYGTVDNTHIKFFNVKRIRTELLYGGRYTDEPLLEIETNR